MKKRLLSLGLALCMGALCTAPAYAARDYGIDYDLDLVEDYDPHEKVFNSRGPVTLRAGQVKDLSDSVLRSYKGEEHNVADSWSIRDFSWTTSNPEVATVDKKGVVTAHRRGSARIVATGWDNRSRQHEQSFIVGVRDRQGGTPQTSLTVELGGVLDLSQLAGKDAVWSATPERIAAVDENGQVTGESVGRCTVSAAITGKNGKESVRKFTVHVRTKATTINAQANTLVLAKGDTVDLLEVFYPNYAGRSGIRSALRCHATGDKARVSGTEITAKETGSCTVTISEPDEFYGIAEKSVKIKIV